MIAFAVATLMAFTDTTAVHACLQRGSETIVATDGGVVMTQGGTSRVLTALDGLPDTRAYAALDTPEGLWVGTDRGAVLLGGDLQPRRTALASSVRALAMFHGDLLAGTFGGGVADLTRGTTLAVPDARILSLSTLGGTLDVGTMTGVFRLSGAAFTTVSSGPAFGAPVSCSVPSNGLPSNDVSAVAADGATLWVGTFDHGLARLDGDRFRATPGVDPRIDALAIDRRSRRVWVGTARGLYAVDGESQHLVVSGEEVHALAPLDGGGVLAGTSHGALVVREAVTHVGAKDGVESSSVTAVLARGETLYLGTTGGLFIGTPGHFTRMSVAGGQLPDDWVTALAVRGEVVYAGTYNAGVVRIEGQRVTRLGGGYVNPAGITLDGDTVYVATMDGLLASTGGGPLAARERASLGRDVTGVAVGSLGTFVASRRGVLRL